MYAEQSDKSAKASSFAQRAHQDVLEQLPIFFTVLLTSSPLHPGIAGMSALLTLLCFLGLWASVGLAIEAGLRITGLI
ncbi:Microsomal glutathione s-transferase [Globisporangium polare]